MELVEHSLTWDCSLGFIIFLFASIILEHHGAFEQWSLWSTAQLKDCSLGLLQIFLLESVIVKSNTE